MIARPSFLVCLLSRHLSGLKHMKIVQTSVLTEPVLHCMYQSRLAKGTKFVEEINF